MIRLRDIEERQEKESLPENPLKSWRAKFDNNSLTTEDFITYFNAACPFFIIVNKEEGETETVTFDEQSAKGAILDALEDFICGDNPQNVLDKLKSENNVAAVCGRVFKIGEPTYCCRECGMDPTCVLCVNCFKQSAHRHHKYKMGTSNGGGCCDCGDAEAWKRDPYCDQHIQGLTNTQIDNPVITERIKNACGMVFHAVLSYCTTSLEIDCNGTMSAVDEDEDFYCTVLYNDETHTYEQVIQTLTRTVACPHKNAVDYVTSVDRDGRAVVFCGSFAECMRLKGEVEKQSVRNIMHAKTQPLRVTVLHKKGLSYQQFALQLLGWLQQFLMHSASFRKVFCDIITMNTDYNINHLLSNDCKLWKMARTSWHKVLISGMLMEYENKKKLAVVFTKLYASVMQDYIRDDHDHSFSIVSLSVQLFTVPTVAHHLIAHESAFFILMQTFYAESVEKYVQNKVLQFAKTTINLNVFKRAAYILYDVRYLLNIAPDVWTDDLRKGFLHGMQILIKLLRVMQGMDAVHRQTGSHIEHEPEWESAFNLHIKLAYVISLALDWCRTDKVVLVKVYRMVLASLSECEFIVSQTMTKVQELADHSVTCLMYDVASQPVSIHLPLSRFFAGLYLHLEKFGLSYYTVSAPSSGLSLVHLIEPVLCTQTMIAQVHAGMWRRNGYSLLNQLYFYRNVKCRSEMLDRDIVTLQIGASLIERNEFLIHVINKFNLMSWVSPTPWTTPEVDSRITEEDNIRQTINMVDEFLELLIIIIGERYMPGIGRVTEEDRLKKEIIQQLCIKPFAHSELNRTLPDIQHETGMENVINAVAIFNKPAQADRKGVYELKPEFYDMYNMFFYHYSKEEKSKSEEAQRKRKNAKRTCCLPPKLPKLTEAFCMIADLLQCDVMLLIMQTVLEKSLDLKERTFSEGHLQKVLFLIGYGLQDEESGNYPFLMFHERAIKWNILHLLTELATCPRVEALTEHIQWTVKKFKEIQARGEDSGAGSSTSVAMEQDDTAMTSDEQEAAEKQERARLAAEHRAKIMAQMANAQKNFMTENAALFESTKVEYEREETQDFMEWENANEQSQSIACLGPNRKVHMDDDQVVSCILCSEDVNVSKGGPCMVYSAYVQKSTLIYGPARIYPHVSSCGHVMHANCWLEYFNNEVQKETRRPYRNRSPASFDTDKKEFLCPLCRCLSNTVIPLASSLPLYYIGTTTHQHATEHVDFSTWCDIMRKFIDGLGSEEEEMLSIDAILEEYNEPTRELFVAACPPLKRQIDRDLIGHVSDFVTTMKDLIGRKKINKHVEMWLACVYTIQSVEMLLRAQGKPLKGHLSIRQLSCLCGLIRMCGTMGFAMMEKEKRELLALFPQYHVLCPETNCLLDTNLFQSLVVTVFMTPCVMYVQKRNPEDLLKSDCVIPTGQMMEFYLLKQAFILNIAKILITFNPTVEVEEDAVLEDALLKEVHQKAEERYKKEQEEKAKGKNKPQETLSMESPSCSTIVFTQPIQNVTTKTTSMEVQEDPDDVPMEAQTEEKKGGKDNGLVTMLAFFRLHNIYVGSTARRIITPSQLIEEIKEKSSTFLRSATLLFHFITGIEMPQELEELGGDTFELMCEYLGLDANIESYFVCKKSLEMMTRASLHPTIEAMRKGEMEKKSTPTYLPVKELVALPEDYSDLINSVSLFTCPNNSRDDTRNPTMCLVCGEVLCSQTYCCQSEINRMTVGACTYHAHVCGAGIVPLLRIRECEVMLLSVSKGCFISPPYLDEYGEYDAGLRRGNPLHLCRERYEKLRIMWLSHGFYEEIARTMEITNTMPPTQWELL
ncbi:E3 ubiquitin-protein ligase UBR1 [Lutzomyia longipalpis]|uniref:E3 ubiquitin-protein ligase UBR1 n=1 Tax=Lutzomyia longipalpis TaxID=7200 RepID=UPI002483591C|nr:E3 ubiquitin-protein ligase UBR1 [Lutzomyia longipalpis]